MILYLRFANVILNSTNSEDIKCNVGGKLWRKAMEAPNYPGGMKSAESCLIKLLQSNAEAEKLQWGKWEILGN